MQAATIVAVLAVAVIVVIAVVAAHYYNKLRRHCAQAEVLVRRLGLLKRAVVESPALLQLKQAAVHRRLPGDA